MYVWKTEAVAVYHKKNFCMFEKQRILLFCNKTSSPNPSYLHFGEFVLVWDAKNWSSHSQIIHIDILRVQIYLKSDEKEGTRLPSIWIFLLKIDFWAERCLGGTMSQNLCVFQPKWPERPFRVDETTASVTKSAACA